MPRKPLYVVGIDPFSEKFMVTIEHRDSYEVKSTHDTVEAAWAAKQSYEQADRRLIHNRKPL